MEKKKNKKHTATSPSWESDVNVISAVGLHVDFQVCHSGRLDRGDISMCSGWDFGAFVQWGETA